MRGKNAQEKCVGKQLEDSDGVKKTRMEKTCVGNTCVERHAWEIDAAHGAPSVVQE